MADEMPELQRMAAYKPNTLLSIGNVLTGGLLGLATGQTQRIQERNFARRKIIEEQALMDRMKAQEELRLKAAIDDETRTAAQQAQRATGGLQGIAGAPTDETGMSPFFATGYRQAQFEQAKAEAERTAEEKRNMPRNRAIIEAAGGAIPEDATPAQLAGMASVASSTSNLTLGQRKQVEVARAYLDSKNIFVPQGASDAQILNQANELKRQEERNAPTAAQRNIEAYQGLVERLVSSKDPKEIAQLEALLPKAIRESDAVQSALLATDSARTPLGKEERKTLNATLKKWEDGVRVIDAISALTNQDKVADVSRLNFNKLRQIVRDPKVKIFGDDTETGNQVNRVLQEVEAFIQGDRKMLFGQTLSGTEQASALKSFGDPNSANFLVNVVNYLDRVYQDNPASRLKGIYKRQQLNPYESSLGSSLERYKETRNTLKGVSPFGEGFAGRQVTAAPSPAPGATNAPAGAQSEIPEVIRGPDGQLRYK
jgi:hypothetical protein